MNKREILEANVTTIIGNKTYLHNHNLNNHQKPYTKYKMINISIRE